MSWDLWVAIGFLGQFTFAARFIVQWIASERERRSHVPIQFWYLSLVGGAITTAYAIHRRDPVFIVGQASGLVVYIRNLMLIHRHAHRDPAQAAPADRP
jgi:lipid-A-disaccharide synthase-like uncharacterized protein